MTYFLTSTPFMVRRLLTSALVIVLLVPSSASAAYQQKLRFVDVTNAPSDAEQAEATTERKRTIVERAEKPMITDAEADVEIAELATLTPGQSLTRAQFTALVIDTLYAPSDIHNCYWDIASTLPPDFTLVYTDVPVTSPYAKHLCVAMRDGIARGFTDGSFKPNREINVAESSAILSRAFVLAPYAHLEKPAHWFQPYVEALAVRNALPTDFTALEQQVTMSNLGELMDRLQNNITWRPSRSLHDLMPKAVLPVRKATVTNPATPVSGQGSSPKGSAEESATSSEGSDEEDANTESDDEMDEDSPWWDLF